MQRKMVGLPEPDGPMMQTTSLFSTEAVMPLSTSTEPKLLWTLRSSIIGGLLVPPDGKRRRLAGCSLGGTLERTPVKPPGAFTHPCGPTRPPARDTRTPYAKPA